MGYLLELGIMKRMLKLNYSRMCARNPQSSPRKNELARQDGQNGRVQCRQIRHNTEA